MGFRKCALLEPRQNQSEGIARFWLKSAQKYNGPKTIWMKDKLNVHRGSQLQTTLMRAGYAHPLDARKKSFPFTVPL